MTKKPTQPFELIVKQTNKHNIQLHTFELPISNDLQTIVDFWIVQEYNQVYCCQPKKERTNFLTSKFEIQQKHAHHIFLFDK